MKLETFSYLPPLTTQQVLRQVHYLLGHRIYREAHRP